MSAQFTSIKRISFVSFLTSVMLLIGSISFAQETPPPPSPEEGKAKDSSRYYMETMLVFADGFQGKMIDQILMWLTDDVEVYVFPDDKRGTGKIEAKIFLEDVLNTQEDLHFEKGEFSSIGHTWMIRFRRHPVLEKGKEEMMAILLFKGEKIHRVYFVNL